MICDKFYIQSVEILYILGSQQVQVFDMTLRIPRNYVCYYVENKD